MKKLFAALLALMMISGCTSTTTTTTTEAVGEDMLATIQSKGEMVVALEGVYAPWNYHDADTDELVGYDVEVAKLVGEKLGVNVKFEECPWDSIFAGIDSGRYDMACASVTVTEERQQKYDFSDGYAFMKTVVIVAEDNNDITKMEDLAGKKTANTLSSTYSEIAESYGAETIGVDDLEQTIEVVKTGRVDATLNADVTFYDYMNVHPEAPVKIACSTDEVEMVAIPVLKGENSTSFLEAVNNALAELADEGKLTELSMKYFGGDISHK